MAVDAVSLLVGWSAGCVVGKAVTDKPLPQQTTGLGMIVVGVVASLACFAVAGMYRSPINGIRSAALGRLVHSTGLAAVIVIVWQGIVGNASPRVALGAVAAALATTVISRCAFDVWLIGRRERGDFCTPVVVAGTADEATRLADFLELNPEAGLRPTAVVGERAAFNHEAACGPQWMGGLDRIGDAMRGTGATGVLVAVDGLSRETLNRLVNRLSLAGIPVHLSPGLTGISRARLQPVALAHEPMVLVDPPRRSIAQAMTKRALDLVMAALVLLVTAPLFVLTAVLIKVHDGGPVFFRQVRIGRDGRPFTLVKFRTMEVDAESRLAELRVHNERHGPLFKVSDDPRVTPIGGLLRSTAIDELPQLVNVLSGRMSIVGPRPALPAENAEFDDELRRRNLVRPGVTGLWQVEASHKASFEEYRRLDLFYVDNWSLGTDLTVMVDTVQAISRRVLETLHRPAPPAPASVGSPPVPEPAEVSS
jgi:exopolysaccharide biosynthesis polyprenyl glycosylphosphotransferase